MLSVSAAASLFLWAVQALNRPTYGTIAFQAPQRLKSAAYLRQPLLDLFSVLWATLTRP